MQIITILNQSIKSLQEFNAYIKSILPEEDIQYFAGFHDYSKWPHVHIALDGVMDFKEKGIRLSDVRITLVPDAEVDINAIERYVRGAAKYTIKSRYWHNRIKAQQK